MSKKLLSMSEAADQIGITIATLRRWADKGAIKSLRATPNGNRYFLQQDIEDFLSGKSEHTEVN